MSTDTVVIDPPASARRATVIEILAWLAVATMGMVALSQAIGRTLLPPMYALQATTPFLLAPAVPVAVVASLRGRHLMALTCVGIAAALLWLTWPVIAHDDPLSAPASAPTFTLTHSNAYFRNTSPDAAAEALLAQWPDVLAVTEQSPQLEAALAAGGVGERYAFRAGSSSERRNGVALYSRFPFIEATVRDIGGQPGIDATIDVGGIAVRVLVVHPLPGVDTTDLSELERGLPAIDAMGRADRTPTVIVGDFNASRWHPAFRRLLSHWTDVHESLGQGFSVSWPENKIVPPFVRLDHALMDDGVTALAAHDVDVPGSDHRGFTVILATRVSG
ncbi:MAG: endonuclease/exonuclease/phosphatase family protein [Ilumatobacteraceae bacterium]